MYLRPIDGSASSPQTQSGATARWHAYRERERIEADSFYRVPIGPFPGSLPISLRAEASTTINTALPGLPHILSAPKDAHTRALELHRRPRKNFPREWTGYWHSRVLLGNMKPDSHHFYPALWVGWLSLRCWMKCICNSNMESWLECSHLDWNVLNTLIRPGILKNNLWQCVLSFCMFIF